MASALGLAVDQCKNLILGRQFPFADPERRKVRSVHQLVRARARDAQHRSKLLGIQHVRVVLICHPFHIHPPPFVVDKSERLVYYRNIVLWNYISILKRFANRFIIILQTYISIWGVHDFS